MTIRVVGVYSDQDERAQLRVTVQDTGIGIAADKVGHIFGEFNQVDDEHNRKYQGTGLGLAISQKLVALMEGDIWVESEQGHGSCFGFSLALPVAERMEPDCYRLPPGLITVLVVDPNETSRGILCRQLEAMGLTARPCVSGHAAVEQISPDIHVVITEHHMAEMDGMELAMALRGQDCSVPIIVVSDSLQSAQNDPAFAHLHGVVQKPYPRRDLAALLQSLAPLTQAVAESEDPTRKTQQAPARVLRVLAAEDNKTNRLVFSKMVKALDIDLQFAENGVEAVALYQSFRPDVIFTDISMPEMDGKQAAQEIRKLDQGSDRHVPIIAMTAHAMDGDAADILNAGIDHYLTKPLKKSLIIDHIQAAWQDGMRPPVAEDQDG